MPNYPNATPEPPYFVDVRDAGFLHDDHGAVFPIIRRTRRTVTIDRHGSHVSLKRRLLETAGHATAGTMTYRLRKMERDR